MNRIDNCKFCGSLFIEAVTQVDKSIDTGTIHLKTTYKCKTCGSWWDDYGDEFNNFYTPSIGTGTPEIPTPVEPDQAAKHDGGKPQMSLAPITEMWKSIARVREFGCKKYEKENWKTVEVSRYWDALYRHLSACLQDPYSVDEESGLPHLAHAATNIAFIMELDPEFKDGGNKNGSN